jgi:hypothetical protein
LRAFIACSCPIFRRSRDVNCSISLGSSAVALSRSKLGLSKYPWGSSRQARCRKPAFIESSFKLSLNQTGSILNAISASCGTSSLRLGCSISRPKYYCDGFGRRAMAAADGFEDTFLTKITSARSVHFLTVGSYLRIESTRR